MATVNIDDQVQHFVKQLFDRAGLELNKNQPINNVSSMTRFNDCICPFALTNREFQLTTNLHELVKFDSNVPIVQIPSDQLAIALRLEVPKKIIRHFVQTTDIPQPSKEQVAKPKKQRGPQGPRQPKPQTVELATIYATDGHRKKRERIEADIAPPLEPQIQFVTIPKPQVVDLYPILNGIFQEFWEMDFGDDAAPFFARITCANCLDYHLPNFAVESFCLAVIKDRLMSKHYRTGSAFASDFRQMVTNIITYYDPTHSAHSRARKIGELFEEKWSSVQTKVP